MGPIDRRSDDELVAICNVGGALDAARAFEALYRRHRDFVLRVARRFTHDRELALDVPLGTVKSRLQLALKELREDSRIKDLFDP